MQLGVALFIHANLQPYVVAYFFDNHAYQGRLSNFFPTFLVYAFCVLGLLIGLPLGKRVLEPKVFTTGELPKTQDPRYVYLFGSFFASLCVLLASFLPSSHFWLYAVIMGLAGGFFSGVAYQAPMVASQLFFPDWKSGINNWLMVGLAVGIVTYSCLTAVWATTDCDNTAAACEPNLTRLLRYLAFCMFGHSALATILLSMPHQHLNVEDMSQL